MSAHTCIEVPRERVTAFGTQQPVQGERLCQQCAQQWPCDEVATWNQWGPWAKPHSPSSASEWINLNKMWMDDLYKSQSPHARRYFYNAAVV